MAVGNHSFPPNTSPADMFLSSIRLRSASSGTIDPGTKAIIPGVEATSEAIAAPACSYWAPSCSCVKYLSASSRRKGTISMSSPPRSFQLVTSSSNTALISAAVRVDTGFSLLSASTYPSSTTGSRKSPAPSVKRNPMISRMTTLVTNPLAVSSHFTAFSRNFFIQIQTISLIHAGFHDGPFFRSSRLLHLHRYEPLLQDRLLALRREHV